ncbi:MAG: sporulation protein YqfD [Oscillospiraceae bacterium]|nr:sporulation protein YqfD [Oscillospiraceae bacterium]
MRLYRLRSRTGFLIYSEQGRDTKKFINALRNSPIKFFGLSVRNERLYGYVGTRDYPAVKYLAEQHRLTCEKIDEKGAAKRLSGYKRRVGLIIGAILSAAMVMSLSDRVMMIEVGGNENIPTDRILSHLEDAGIFIGSRISSVDMRLAERQVAAMDKDIDWVGIKHIGSRVTVEINEIKAPPEMERKNTPCNIVAAHDAQITGVKLYSGMLIPMVGDGVKKGDIIVSGVVDTKYGRSFFVHSMGEITGIYNEKMTFSQSLVTEEKYCTGEESSKALKIFGTKLAYSPPKLPHEDYEYYETEERLNFLGLPLPAFRITGHYRIMESRSISLTPEEADQIINERIEKYEKNFLSGNASIIDREFTKTSDEKGLTVTVNYTLEGDIGEEKAILAKYEPPQPYEEKEKK